MRYKGQSYELTVPFSKDFIHDFHKLHEKTYGYRINRDVEIVNLRLRGIGELEKIDIEKISEGSSKISENAILSEKQIIFEGKKYKTKIIDRGKLVANNKVEAPAIIVEYSSTTVIPPFAMGYIDEYGNIRIEV